MTENSIQTAIFDERKFRLHFLDGMRGIAAFYVLLTHLWLYQGENLPWRQLSMVFAAIAIFTEWNKLGIPAWIYESFAGIAAACLIIDCTKIILSDKKRHIILQILESSWIIKLGAFSYSLYLTHAPVITILRQLLTNLNMSPTVFAITLYTVGIIVSLALASVFYLTIERPFMLLLKSRKKLAAN